MGKISLIFIKHWIPEILKLSTEADPVWVERAYRIPGKSTAQGNSQEVQLFLTFQTCATKSEF